MKPKMYKVLVIVIVGVAVSAAVLFKVKSRKPSLSRVDSGLAPQIFIGETDTGAVPLSEKMPIYKSAGPIGEVEKVTDETGKKGEEKESRKPEGRVLATVNGRNITEKQLESFLAGIPAQQRAQYESDKVTLLDNLIIREALLQEAEKRGVEKWFAVKENLRKYPKGRNDILIEALLKQESEKVSVSDQEAREFFNSQGEYFKGSTFDSMKDRIKMHVLGEKQNERVNEFVREVHSKATVVKNEGWVRQQEALRPKTPLDTALKSGRVVLADFGQDNCAPCKMMKPILDKLAEEYKGRAEILIIDTRDYPALAGKYGIRAIPTQIFFDEKANEVYRHMGFMDRDAIIEKLKEMGVK